MISTSQAQIIFTAPGNAPWCCCRKELCCVDATGEELSDNLPDILKLDFSLTPWCVCIQDTSGIDLSRSPGRLVWSKSLTLETPYGDAVIEISFGCCADVREQEPCPIEDQYADWYLSFETDMVTIIYGNTIQCEPFRATASGLVSNFFGPLADCSCGSAEVQATIFDPE